MSRNVSVPTSIRIDPDGFPPAAQLIDDDVPGVSRFWRRSEERSRWLSCYLEEVKAFEAAGTDSFDDARLRAAGDRLSELSAQLPCLPHGPFSISDVITWARLAYVWADRDSRDRVQILD